MDKEQTRFKGKMMLALGVGIALTIGAALYDVFIVVLLGAGLTAFSGYMLEEIKRSEERESRAESD